MLETLHSVDQAFYEIFMGEKFWERDLTVTPAMMVVKDYNGQDVSFRCMYFRQSAQNYTELPDESYPVMSIQNYTPELIKEWAEMHKEYRLAGFEDTDDDGNYDRATLYSAPVPLLCRYELNAACKSERHWDAVKQYMLSTFGHRKQNYLTLNKFLLPLIADEEFGDKVYYNFEWRDIPRSDGVFETMFTFALKAWVKLHPDKDVDLLRRLNIRQIVKSI